MYDIIIIGAGPAGLTASIYATRSAKKTLVLEANSYGGQIINTLDIENYPANNHISGFDLATSMYNQAKELGAEIVFEKAIDIKNKNNYKEVVTNKNTYKTKTIILATGSDNRHLNIPLEEKLIGKGISYCATCDGNLYKNKEVAVVGGGNAAIEEALYLSNIAKTVYLICRKDKFKADQVSVDKLLKKDNIKIIYNTNVTKLMGDDKLESIEIKGKNTKELNISGLFVAIGRIPENENFSSIINLDKNGYVKSDDCHTNVGGIFVAGDCRTKNLRQIVTATSDGAIAATEAIKYLNKM